MKRLVFFTVIIFGLFACKSADSLYEEVIVPGGITYPGIVTNVTATPGRNRIKISWDMGTDPKVVKVRIFWNNYTDTVEVAIEKGTRHLSRIIEPLEENTYSFIVHTYDAAGNVSVPVEVIGMAYGEMWERSLVNRILREYSYDGLQESLSIEWRGAANKETGINLRYTDIDNEPQTLFIDRKETVTLISNFNVDRPLFYETMYLPDTTAIDTFRAQTVEMMIDPNVLLSKAFWTEHTLPGDIAPINTTFPLRNLWNGTLTSGNEFRTQENLPLPCTFTWDLGVNTVLNRMRLWPRDHADDRWRRGHPREFEIYGSLAAPNPNGSLADWTLLGRFVCVKPSPGAAITEADLALAREGIEFVFVKNDFADPSIPVRYIRFRALSTFREEALTPVAIQEISFWGRLVK